MDSRAQSDAVFRTCGVNLKRLAFALLRFLRIVAASFVLPDDHRHLAAA
ncbi:hypothetical protein ACVWW4_003819 [Bradyrhizobium sp. LB7.1]